MKKRIIFVLLVLIVCFSGCTADIKAPDMNNAQTDENENNIDEITENISKENNAQIKQDGTESEQPPEILDVDKKALYINEMHIDCPEFLAKSKFSSLVLSDEWEQKYPLLGEKLKTVSTMINNTMTSEFENHIAFANEDVSTYGFDGWKPYVSTFDVHLRRADSVAFSTLSDSYTDTPYIKDFRSLMGSVYDTQTGKELVITDVIKDMSVLPAIIEKEITSHMWTGDFHSENALEEYFKNTAPADIYWTLDYNGVTFYFYAGSIAAYEYGIITATVGFEEYPDIFEERYTKVPESYAVRIPVTASFFTNLDDDTELEELVVTAHRDETFDFYSELYIVTADDFYAQDFSAYKINPYYIKTADGRHLLYVFGEGAEDFNRLMRLYVYEIREGKINKIGTMPLAPHHSVSDDSMDVFAVPSNPEKMHFDFFTEEPDYQYPVFDDSYSVGKNLLPIRSGESEDIPEAPEFNPEGLEEIEFEESDLSGTSWQGYTYVNQQSGIPERCSMDINDDSFVSLEFFHDGGGIIKYDARYSDFIFYCDSQSSCVLNLGEEGNRYFNIYTDNEINQHWIMMQMDEYILWLYKINK